MSKIKEDGRELAKSLLEGACEKGTPSQKNNNLNILISASVNIVAHCILNLSMISEGKKLSLTESIRLMVIDIEDEVEHLALNCKRVKIEH